MNKTMGFIVFSVFTVAALIISLFSGASGWGFKDSYLFWNIRAARTAAAFITGAGLGVAGAVFQAILRNPLAAPYVAGTSAGASLGVALAALAGFYYLGPAAGFVTGLAITALVYKIAASSRSGRPESLILAGVVMSSLVSALTFLIMVLNRETVFRILFFMTGSLQYFQPGALLLAVILVAAGVFLSFFYSRELDIMTQGDDEAVSLGVNADKIRKILFAVAAMMVAGTVAVAGIIAFAGLIVPHIVRMVFGAGHRRLIIMSALFGGGFLVFADTLARTLFAPMEITAGIITAFCGAPFFLYLLVKK